LWFCFVVFSLLSAWLWLATLIYRTTEAFLSVSQDEQRLFLNNETAFHSKSSSSFAFLPLI
jgi:hypothetical protein